MFVTTRWWWIRHAPVTTYDGRVYGQTDVPADTSDAAAFAGLAATLPSAAQWVTSNLRRTRETAAAIAAAGLDMGEPTIVPDFAEQHFGEWQGKDRREVFGQNAEWHRLWLAPADHTPRGGESFVDVTKRVALAIDRLSQDFSGGDIVAVGHGGSIKAALGHALGLSPREALAFTIDNLSLTRIDHLRGPAGATAWQVGVVNAPPVRQDEP